MKHQLAKSEAQQKQMLERERGEGGECEDRAGGKRVKKKQDYLQDEMKPWVKPAGESLADPEQGPFIAWCEEHFREVNAEDVKKLVPKSDQPKLEEDPDFTMPQKERSYEEGPFCLQTEARRFDFRPFSFLFLLFTSLHLSFC